MAGQVESLGPSGGAAACISRPLPVGVTVEHKENVRRRKFCGNGEKMRRRRGKKWKRRSGRRR